MKKDHHYVPKLILRKFDERLNTFNLKTGEVRISSSKLKNTFSADYLYSQEIENLFNEKIESEFANILNKKILSVENEVVLERVELNTVKKFLLLAMIRTLDSERYIKQRDKTIDHSLKEILNFEEQNIEGISDFDYWMRTIRCILESKDLNSVKNHPEATNQAVRWAYTYNSGYISIWDSSNVNEDFVVIDNGMTSDHEPTRFINEIGNDVLKRGYLFYKIISSTKESSNVGYYLEIMPALDFFTENFYLFSISKNRMIALINPFFRLYDKSKHEATNKLPTPDIWTTRIKDKSLFLKNKYKYVSGIEETLKGNIDDKDLYIYPIRQMTLEDVIYVNCLSFDRIDNILGFADSSRIRRSLSTYSLVKGRKNYTELIDYFEKMGNPIVINDFVRKISKHISPKDIKFNEEEQRYINHFLSLRKMNNSIK